VVGGSGGVGSPSGLNPDPNPIHRWGVALGGSLYLYLPEANALRLSFDRGSAVDGVFLCSAPSGHSESDGGLGLWAHFLTDPLSLAFAQ
jgi:hypothetical protein